MYKNQPRLIVIGKTNPYKLASTEKYFIVLGLNYNDRFYNYYPEDFTITHHITVVVICTYMMDELNLSEVITLSAKPILSVANITIMEVTK